LLKARQDAENANKVIEELKLEMERQRKEKDDLTKMLMQEQSENLKRRIENIDKNADENHKIIGEIQNDLSQAEIKRQ
jgi:hypothetical protein